MAGEINGLSERIKLLQLGRSHPEKGCTSLDEESVASEKLATLFGDVIQKIMFPKSVSDL